MAKFALIVVPLLVATAQAAAALTKQNFFETFSVPNETVLTGQQADNVSVPINGLSWKNLYSTYQYARFGSGPLFNLVIYDPFWYGAFLNSSKPAVITSKYRGSCVSSWELKSFAFGCNAQQHYVNADQGNNFTFQFPSNCTVTVEGLDRHGYCVGREVFHYEPYPLFSSALGFPAGYMKLFNTTRGGLKGKKLEKVKIGVKVVDVEGDDYTYVGGLGAGIDAVSYTVFNKTGCH